MNEFRGREKFRGRENDGHHGRRYHDEGDCDHDCDGTCECVIKTFWMKIIQRKWKKRMHEKIMQ